LSLAFHDRKASNHPVAPETCPSRYVFKAAEADARAAKAASPLAHFRFSFQNLTQFGQVNR
jgi:hypothetical protein